MKQSAQDIIKQNLRRKFNYYEQLGIITLTAKGEVKLNDKHFPLSRPKFKNIINSNQSMKKINKPFSDSFLLGMMAGALEVLLIVYLWGHL